MTGCGMARADWIFIFRSYTTDALTAQKDNLISQMSVFSQQNVGSKSFTRDLVELRDQLGAATFVLQERGFPVNQCIGTKDFSCIEGTGGLSVSPLI